MTQDLSADLVPTAVADKSGRECRQSRRDPSGSAQTVVGRNIRDNVWIMARTPETPAADYDRFVREFGVQGYDVAKLRKVPQRWPTPLPR